MEGIEIRHYRKEDRDSIRRIASETAFMGEPARIFFDSEKVLSSFLTQYFTDYEPASCFVAADSRGKVIGYLLGAKNTTVLNRVFQTKILLRLFVESIKERVWLKKKSAEFIFSCIRSFLHREFRMPDFSKEYPATLHINLEGEFRSSHIGSRLIQKYLGYLTEAGVPGVYLSTMSEAASEFFTKQGFRLLYRGQRSYFRPILHRDIPVYVYGKKLA